jgi:hypothetical protein
MATLNTHKQKLLYDPTRLAQIPSMSSAISSKIAGFKKQHRNLLESATLFFSTYEPTMTRLGKLKKLITTTEKKITLINEYEKKHRHLPKIKGQKSTRGFLLQLYRESEAYNAEFTELKTKIVTLKKQQYENLESLTDNMLDLLDNHHMFSQFLGSMSLSTPLSEEKARCAINEKNKPVFIAALTVLLFDEIRQSKGFTSGYVADNISEIFSGVNQPLINKKLAELPNDTKMRYREELLKPIAKAAVLQSIGSYSTEAAEVYQGDRFKPFQQPERDRLISIINQKSVDYLKQGIGIPSRPFNTKDDKQNFQEYEATKLQFILKLVENKNENHNELSDLLRIPVVYSSFILSTKEEFSYQQSYDAYNIIEQGVSDKVYSEKFGQLFLSIVGKFPIGSGLLFISKINGQIERAMVSGIYPEDPYEPICKQITKGQVQAMTQSEIIISQATNIYFKAARKASEYDEEYYQSRYQGVFVWNANELWEVQIHAKSFWKKDPQRATERN